MIKSVVVFNCFYSESAHTIEDTIAAGKTIDEAVEMLEAEKERFEFFKKFDLIDTGRYWLNRDLKRCLVDDGGSGGDRLAFGLNLQKRRLSYEYTLKPEGITC